MSKAVLAVRVFQILIAGAVLGLDASMIYAYSHGINYEGFTIYDSDNYTLSYGAFVGSWTILTSLLLAIATTAMNNSAIPIFAVIIEFISWAAWAALFSLFAWATQGCEVETQFGFDKFPLCARMEAALGLSVATWVLFCGTFVYSIMVAVRGGRVDRKLNADV